eukprot:TRINITY_DN4780_c0_g1_i4.p1 TRINITY_DN4780_c0_g1~~TRINITY_DN4780_c0_g1_i4.p1  ORF type:complete len:767 (+),score=285.48 TRINITY_DN4780_c0_g1_i4:132-2432(+)
MCIRDRRNTPPLAMAAVDRQAMTSALKGCKDVPMSEIRNATSLEALQDLYSRYPRCHPVVTTKNLKVRSGSCDSPKPHLIKSQSTIETSFDHDEDEESFANLRSSECGTSATRGTRERTRTRTNSIEGDMSFTAHDLARCHTSPEASKCPEDQISEDPRFNQEEQDSFADLRSSECGTSATRGARGRTRSGSVEENMVPTTPGRISRTSTRRSAAGSGKIQDEQKKKTDEQFKHALSQLTDTGGLPAANEKMRVAIEESRASQLVYDAHDAMIDAMNEYYEAATARSGVIHAQIFEFWRMQETQAAVKRKMERAVKNCEEEKQRAAQLNSMVGKLMEQLKQERAAAATKVPVDDAAVERALRDSNEKVSELEAAVAREQEQAAELESEINDMEQTRILNIERHAELCGTLKQLRQQLAEQKSATDLRVSELSKSIAQCSSLQDENDALAQTNRDLTDQLRAAEQLGAAGSSEFSSKHAELQARLHSAEAALAEERQHRARIASEAEAAAQVHAASLAQRRAELEAAQAELISARSELDEERKRAREAAAELQSARSDGSAASEHTARALASEQAKVQVLEAALQSTRLELASSSAESLRLLQHEQSTVSELRAELVSTKQQLREAQRAEAAMQQEHNTAAELSEALGAVQGELKGKEEELEAAEESLRKQRRKVQELLEAMEASTAHLQSTEAGLREAQSKLADKTKESIRLLAANSVLVDEKKAAHKANGLLQKRLRNVATENEQAIMLLSSGLFEMPEDTGVQF